MKRIYLILFLGLFCKWTIAQTTSCAVLVDSIKGTYEGECKNGKANGTGKSVGTDTYDGEFKNGLPEGKGKYTWKNGDYYYGEWKKGLKDGKGELHRFEGGKESLVTGYWKKGNYRGEYANPYVINNVTTDIGRVEVTKITDKDFTLTVTVENLQGGGGAGSGFQPTTVMTAHQVTRGSYVSKSNNVLTNKEVTTFRGIIFPFRVILNFGNSTMMDIEIFEQGAWDVKVPINK
jgi:hypothetical protein